MRISETNTVRGIVREVRVGETMATIRIQFGENVVESALPMAALDDIGIKVGDEVTALIETTPVDIIK